MRRPKSTQDGSTLDRIAPPRRRHRTEPPVSLHRATQLPADVAQIVAEYAPGVASLLTLRAVSRRWQASVTEAVGYLNGRNWNELNYAVEDLHPLEWHYGLVTKDANYTVINCCVVCLWCRLDSLRLRLQDARARLVLPIWSGSRLRRLELLAVGIAVQPGASLRIMPRIDTLEQLDLRGNTRLSDVRALRHCRMIREIDLSNTGVTAKGIAGLEQLASLEILRLQTCSNLTDVSSLSRSVSVRELDVEGSPIADRGFIGLERVPTLQSLCLGGTEVTNLTAFHSNSTLTNLNVPGTKIGADDIGKMPLKTLILNSCRKIRSVASFCRNANLVVLGLADTRITTAGIDGLQYSTALQELDLSGTTISDVRHLCHCPALRDLNLTGTEITSEALGCLSKIPTLEVLSLQYCRVNDVASLRACPRLRELHLEGADVTGDGIAGLEHIQTLETLDLNHCVEMTCVRRLGASTSLQTLTLRSTSVNDDGIIGLEQIPTLRRLNLSSTQVTDVCALARCSALRILELGDTEVSTIAGLELIPTLEMLVLMGTRVETVASLRHCKSLNTLHLPFGVSSDGVLGLELIPTLTELGFGYCRKVQNVTHLRHCRALRTLDLSDSAVTDSGIRGLELISTLEDISIANTVVSDVSAFRQCRALRRLNVAGSKVPNAAGGQYSHGVPIS
jgi:Leucine-rich repeat (LRR) protein